MLLTPKLTKQLYVFAAIYALLMLLVREDGVVLITVLGFGFPVLVFLLIEWAVPVIVAVIAGFQSKWSFRAAIHAFPLLVVFACISPIVSGKNTVLPVHLPWMAAPASAAQAFEEVVTRAPWWLLAYILALVVGRVMRPASSKTGESNG